MLPNILPLRSPLLEKGRIGCSSCTVSGMELVSSTVADPGFSRGGAPTPKLGLFGKFFAENCMKMKESRPPGGRVPGAPLRSSNVQVFLPYTYKSKC